MATTARLTSVTLGVEPYSDDLDPTMRRAIFFAEDEAAKQALVKADATGWSVCIKDELRVLGAQSRARPFLS